MGRDQLEELQCRSHRRLFHDTVSEARNLAGELGISQGMLTDFQLRNATAVRAAPHLAQARR